MLTADGLIDGSWDLTVHVTDVNVDKTIRARGDLNVGGLMIRVVNALEAGPLDWSDHAIWWPSNNTWLLRTRRTLDQYDVHAGDVLWFTPMHKTSKVQFPDLQVFPVRLNFSTNVFNNVIVICKQFGIRHPEELSLLRQHEEEEVKRRQKSTKSNSTKTRPLSSKNPNTLNQSMGDGFETASIDSLSADIMLSRSTDNLFDANATYGSTDQLTTCSQDNLTTLTLNLKWSPVVKPQESVNLHLLFRPRDFVEKAKMNSRWLDSAVSLMEQGVKENDTVYLRFKYATFFDLKPKYDAARINQIYEQARWSIITEQVQCSDEEIALFTALQLFIQSCFARGETDVTSFDSGLPGSVDGNITPMSPVSDVCLNDGTDDIEAALNDLQQSLDVDATDKANTNSDVTKNPQLNDYMILRRQNLGMKSYKKRYFVLSDSQLKVYNNSNTTDANEIMNLNVRGCDVRSEVDVSSNKFLIKLTTMVVLPSQTRTELTICQTSMEQHANWLTGFRLAARRRTLADCSFTSQLEETLALLKLRQTAAATAAATTARGDQPLKNLDTGMLENCLTRQTIQRIGKRQLTKRVQEVYKNLLELSVIDAKLTFIKAWQNLPEASFAYFVVIFKGSKKNDLVAVGERRLLHLDIKTGQCLNEWPYDKMTSWSVNWNSEQVKIELESDKEREIAFKCVSADCKVVHEYIGGHVFLAMRSLSKNQTLDEKLFFKLTGGRQ